MKDVCAYNCAISPTALREKVMFQLKKVLNAFKAEILRMIFFFDDNRMPNFAIKPVTKKRKEKKVKALKIAQSSRLLNAQDSPFNHYSVINVSY